MCSPTWPGSFRESGTMPFFWDCNSHGRGTWCDKNSVSFGLSKKGAHMKFHPIADIFPMMADQEFRELQEDIERNRLREPICLYEGKILDGRNRYLACKNLTLDPKVKIYKGSNPIDFIISMNLRRRHLRASQRAAIAVDALPLFEAAARKRQAHGQTAPGRTLTTKMSEASQGEAAEHAAKAFGVSKTYIKQAKAIKKETPKSFSDLKSGKQTITEARRNWKREKAAKDRAKLIRNAPKAVPFVGEWAPDQIYQAEVSTVLLPAESVDLVVTDPPWSDESLSVYTEVASLAAHVLRPGAFCALYAGKMFLPQVLRACEGSLEYVWTFAAVQFDNNTKIAKWHLFGAWRPILLFRKAGPSREMPWIPDAFRCQREKSYHEWQQGSEPIKKIIEAYSLPGGLVLDPCVGGGTVPAVAQRLGRHFLGFDKDPNSVRLTLARLKEEAQGGGAGVNRVRPAGGSNLKGQPAQGVR